MDSPLKWLTSMQARDNRRWPKNGDPKMPFTAWRIGIRSTSLDANAVGGAIPVARPVASHHFHTTWSTLEYIFPIFWTFSHHSHHHLHFGSSKSAEWLGVTAPWPLYDRCRNGASEAVGLCSLSGDPPHSVIPWTNSSTKAGWCWMTSEKSAQPQHSSGWLTRVETIRHINKQVGNICRCLSVWFFIHVQCVNDMVRACTYTWNPQLKTYK